MSITTEEKIKQLVELERAKRSEIEEKKKELDKKKKEVEALERQKQSEITDARRQLQEKIAELVGEEKKHFEETEEARRKKKAVDESLEEKLGGPEKQEQQHPVQRGYGEAIDSVMRGTPDFYDLTNYNVMNRLESIADEAVRRGLTKEEQDFVAIVEYHAKNLAKDDFYKDKEGATYLKKELSRIDFINRQSRKEEDRSDYST